MGRNINNEHFTISLLRKQNECRLVRSKGKDGRSPLVNVRICVEGRELERDQIGE